MVTAYLRLIRKLANVLDDVDVTHVHVGQVFQLSESHAAMLVAEGWAERTGCDVAQPPTPDKPRGTSF